MHKFRFYGLLVGLSIMIMMTCDTLAFKVVQIGSYDFAASGLIYSLSFALSTIITEVYGFNLAGRIVWIQLICHVLYIFLVNLFVMLPSPENSTTAALYFSLYHNLWHVLLGSCIAMPTSYFTNDIIVSKLKINLYGKKFILRFFISNIIGSAVLVLISYPVNFYNIYPLQHIFLIAFNTWIYKIVAATILFPIAMSLITFFKKIEKVDHYDYGISYNPFKVFSLQNIGETKYEACSTLNQNHTNYRYSSYQR